MSKLIEIENALRAIDPSTFQRLCDSYLRQRGYEKPNPIGLVIGAAKVKKGTPDTLVPLPNGSYVFAEYTTEQGNVGAKLLRDLTKCFDEEKTGIPVGLIEEVVLCHTSVLNAAEEHALVECCKHHGCRLNVFGLGPLAHDLAENYPGLARDHLGIEVDTGQIVKLDEFIAAYSRNALATPLDTTFRFRSDQLQQTVDNLSSADLVLVAGRPGVGKSRFAVESCRAYSAANPGVEVRCIRNLGADLSTDIRTHFTPPRHYLILVDDANRVTGFDYLLHLLHENRLDRTVKIIVTVRDYALPKVEESVRPFGGGVRVELTALRDEQIKELAEQEFGIKNFHYLERIAEISRGNPRLAVMASRIAVEQNTLASIADVSALYDEYFRSVRQDLGEVANPMLLQVAGIIAFYRAVDRSNEAQQREVAEGFGIEVEAFWGAVHRLNELELVDLYEKEVARISDQVLATYLLYLAFFRVRVLDPSVLLRYFFPKHRLKLFDALNPVLSAFDSKGIVDQLRPTVSQRWTELDHPDTADELLVFADAFGGFDPTATLRLIRDRIREIPSEPLELADVSFAPSSSFPDHSVYGLMGQFRQADVATVRIVLELLITLSEKRPTELKHALHLLVDTYGFKPTSHLSGFEVQRAVAEELGLAARDGENLLLAGAFLVLAERYLRTHFTHIESKTRNTITHMEFELPVTRELIGLRGAIWQRVLALYAVPELQEDVLAVIWSHANAGYHVGEAGLLASDAAEVLPGLDRLLDPERYTHCAVVQGYLHLLRERHVQLDAGTAELAQRLEERFASEAYRIAALMLDEFDDLQQRANLGWEEHVDLKRGRLREHVAAYGAADYGAFLRRCIEIREGGRVLRERGGRWEERSTESSRDEYQLRMGIAEVFSILAERDSDLFARVITDFLAAGDALQLDPGSVVPLLLASIGTQATAKLLDELALAHPGYWWITFFRALPPEQITPEWSERLLQLYQQIPAEDLSRGLDYLLLYTGTDPGIIVKVTRILVDRVAEDPRVGYALIDLTGHGALADKLKEIFAAEPRVLEQAYFAASKVEPHTDYNAKVFAALLDLDLTFGVRWVEWMAQQKEWLSRYDDRRHYQSLWLRDDYEAVFRPLLNRLLEMEESRPSSLFSYPEVFFTVSDGSVAEEMKTIRERQDTLLLKLIEEHAQDIDFISFLFSVISHFGADRRRAFVAAFLRQNQRIQDFERLPLEPSSWGWSGSRVPMLQGRAEFYESLSPLMNTADLLDHKLLIERTIAELRKEIEREKRKDFMGED